MSAVGQLNRPNLPADRGPRVVRGTVVPLRASGTTRVDLAGKRVAVIGTGASGFQLIPKVAERGRRAAPCSSARPTGSSRRRSTTDDMTEPMKWLFRTFPATARGTGSGCSGAWPKACCRRRSVDPDWPRDGALGERAQRRAARAAHALPRVGVRRRTRAASRTSFPTTRRWPSGCCSTTAPGRRTLKRDNVHLVTDAIEAITADGVTTADGRAARGRRDRLRTGFQASRFLTPMRVVGRDGRDLHEHWDGDARALPRHHRARLPQLLLPLRAQHESRRQRQHHLLLGVHGAATSSNAFASCSPSTSARSTVRVDAYEAYNARIDDGQHADGVGRVDGEQLVQERRRAASPRTGRARSSSSGSRRGRPIPRSTNCSSPSPRRRRRGGAPSARTLPRVASIAKYERNTKPRDAAGPQLADVQHEAVAIAERDVDRELHAEGVHLPAGPQHEHAVDVVAAERPRRAYLAG